jgi:hypothetical protein
LKACPDNGLDNHPGLFSVIGKSPLTMPTTVRGPDGISGLDSITGFVDGPGGEWIRDGGLAERLVDAKVCSDWGVDVDIDDLAWRWGGATGGFLVPSTGG